ncbi:uncharacterized protein [Clinocottus analis]|uniref:uncharacterized protein n=1 Tax=Clinocottus analis TaxID=304258 RepID=UPI0035C1B8D5
MSHTDVFACENGTLFFHQDESFFLAIGHTSRLPLKLESRSPSMLLVSWPERGLAVGSRHQVTLYYTELGSFNTLSTDTTTNNHYRFTALAACSSYVPCVEIAGTRSLTCISTITDPDTPLHFEVTLWNSDSISLAWDCPAKFSSFLLTVFYLDGDDRVTEEVVFSQKEHHFAFVLSDLQPCTRVKFGLQTVCQAGIESRSSRMRLNDGNSAHSRIQALRQTAFGPDNYTLSWEVKNTSSISMFRVYHEGALQAITLITSITVGGLLPCQQYQARVEALCGEGVSMSTKAVAAHTGPHGVSELRYRSNDSTVQWRPHATHQPAVAFFYALSLENGTTVLSSRSTKPELRLSRLEKGKPYVLEVWEECGAHWESERSRLWLERANSSSGYRMRAAGHPLDEEPQFDFSLLSLIMVVPWSLPEEIHDDASELRAKIETIYTDKLQELLKGFHQPARVELASFESAGEPYETEVLFMSFDATQTEADVPLSIEEQLDYIHSLDMDKITVTDGVIRWNGPDLCASPERTPCPAHALCINTLGSFACVCHHGYYDVSAVIKTPTAAPPVCIQKGFFSQCLGKVVTGGIAKPYLASSIGGEVDWGEVDVRLNDGRCSVRENEMFYYFHTSRKASECGTQRRVNKTHIQLQNTLTVTLTRGRIISRSDLKFVWRCVYPRHYVRNAQVSVDTDWLSSMSLMEFNSSLRLGLTMTLHTDESFASSYRGAVTMELEDTLFFQVTLQTNNSFASDVLLQVESCWATESADPQDAVQGVLLQDGCAVDDTFHWLSVNGRAQMSRFSLQMFTMPKGLPVYIHCQANVCGHDEDCTKTCSSQRRRKRSVNWPGREGSRAAVVSAGPLVVLSSRRTSGGTPSDWTVIATVAGLIGFLGVTVLSMSVTKAIVTYYERVQLQ